MTDNTELRNLIDLAVQRGAKVIYSYDYDAFIKEGRAIIDTVHVLGLAGVGCHPMPALAAAEALRRALAPLPQPLRHFLVIGSMRGDDGDHGEYFAAATPEEAQEAFMDALWERDGPTDQRQILQDKGLGAFIVQVFEAPGPITLVP